MATRALLAELAAAHAQAGGWPVVFTSVGGVDAARRVRSAEPFDLVVLAADALAQLASEGHVLADSVRAVVLSSVAVAVPENAPAPDIGSPEALKRALMSAGRIGYSTGPSGTQLLALLARWGLHDQLHGRLVQAPAGVAVASLLAQGEVDLGFQQRSELLGQPGIRLLGDMPAGAEINTVFSAGLCARCRQADAARALIDFLISPATAEAKRRQGMQPA